MTADQDRDRELVERLTSTPELGAMAARAIQQGRYDGTDACLYARRVLDRELGAGPDGAAEWVYRQAAGKLHLAGRQAEGFALRLIADTSSVLAAAAADWHGRYLSRPVTASERAALAMIAAGIVHPVVLPGDVQGGLGADGALYTPASVTADDGMTAPAVIVTTPAGTTEVVTGFADARERAAWLGDRTALPPPGDAAAPAAAPLRSCTGGPDCRTAREERALSWLLTRENPPGPGLVLGERSFTSCTRAEIYLALADARGTARGRPCLPDVRDRLARRMLRAPAWAHPLTGGPFGCTALAYFDRLAATALTALEGRCAFEALVQEDAGALCGRRAEGLRLRVPAARLVPFPRPAPGATSWPPSRYRPDDPAPGPSPRL